MRLFACFFFCFFCLFVCLFVCLFIVAHTPRPPEMDSTPIAASGIDPDRKISKVFRRCHPYARQYAFGAEVSLNIGFWYDAARPSFHLPNTSRRFAVGASDHGDNSTCSIPVL